MAFPTFERVIKLYREGSEQDPTALANDKGLQTIGSEISGWIVQPLAQSQLVAKLTSSLGGHDTVLPHAATTYYMMVFGSDGQWHVVCVNDVELSVGDVGMQPAVLVIEDRQTIG